ncbi:MAG: hypothetical protein M3017_02240 [Actinomycetota bacterium]|nr:hypothetical protein [Actinomycetota bacterium]
MNVQTPRAQQSHTGIDPTERPQIHTNGGTFLIYPDGHVVTVTNEKFEQARRVLARCAFEDPRPAALARAEADFRTAEDECFLEFGLIRRGGAWVFAESSNL